MNTQYLLWIRNIFLYKIFVINIQYLLWIHNICYLYTIFDIYTTFFINKQNNQIHNICYECTIFIIWHNICYECTIFVIHHNIFYEKQTIFVFINTISAVHNILTLSTILYLKKHTILGQAQHMLLLTIT